jgi:hypothetical protein
MRKTKKYKKLLKVINEAHLSLSNWNDPRPMKIWWAEYKKEEKELEERKMNRIFNTKL